MRTEEAYLYWVKFFVRWHGRNGQARHPRELGAAEVEQFLTMLCACTSPAIANLDEDHLELLTQKIKETRSQRASSPSAEKWAAQIPTFRGRSDLRTWKDICDHFKIKVDGDSARRKLLNWVKKNHAEWPPVPDVIA